MNKIQEEYEKSLKSKVTEKVLLNTCDKTEIAEVFFTEGFKAANPLPTKRVCPDCVGTGWDKMKINNSKTMPEQPFCTVCNNEGKLQVYYTPEQYKEIIGKDFPDNALIWYKMKEIPKWTITTYAKYKHIFNDVSSDLKSWGKVIPVLIVQTAQLAPEADYER